MTTEGSTDAPPPEPPTHLSERAAGLWRELVGERRIESPNRVALLQTGLEALDRADQTRQLLDREGLVTSKTSGKMPHAHPAVRIEKDARAQVIRIWSKLGLTWR